MYAISHAATALVLKRRYPEASLWPLLIAVQIVELIWVVLTYAGIEHVSVVDDKVHLDFLPYSHSVATGLLIGLAAWAAVSGSSSGRRIGLALAIGVFSHIVLDVLHHEPDIRLLPFPWGPRFGLGLVRWPLADLLVETAYCVFCWRYFRGSLALLVGLVFLNLMNLPAMFPRPSMAETIAAHPAVLTTLILIQIVLTWIAVWWFARRSRREGFWRRPRNVSAP
jgi:membrane-bound metal-dependent hydrolase YbcI (DUF457 family)